MITFQEEKISDLWEELAESFLEHREFFAFPFFEIHPDKETYQALEDSGDYLFVTAREEDGTLSGYCSYYITYDMHFSDELYAVQDLFYLSAKRRATGVAKNLITFCEAALTEFGVDLITMSLKDKTNSSTLPTMLGYVPEDVLYVKYVGDKAWQQEQL